MSESLSNQREKHPILVLSCQRESHPFQERTIILNEVIKVGRSVARVKPSPTNAIFDCKVLSRSHALIWYKNGRFWLRDTNSSNGTFVNNTRIVKKNEDDSSDREIFSGDIIRFGVDVVEHDTTHGCIIAQVTLFYPSGVEAKNVSAEPVNGSNGLVGIESLHTEQLFRLTHYINEAIFREQLLDSKLEFVKQLLQETQSVSEAGWQAMLNEERLLEKLDLYESQLSVLKQDLPEDCLQSQLAQAQEEKMNLEKASKVMLEHVLKEKAEVFNKATVLEQRLADSERECAQLRLNNESIREAFQKLADDRDAKVVMLDQLEKRLKEADSEKRQLLDRIDQRAREVEGIQGVLDRLTQQQQQQQKTSKIGPEDPLFASDENCKENSGMVNGLENGVAPTMDSAQGVYNDSKKPQQNENRLREGMYDEIAMADIFDADKICEEVDRIPTNSYEQIPPEVVDCVKYLGQSLESLRILQNELEILRNLHPDSKLNSIGNMDTVASLLSSTESSNMKNEPELDQISHDLPNVPNLDVHYVSAALSRVQGLAELVSSYHLKAENCLTQVQKRDQLANISGDVRLPPIELNKLPGDADLGESVNKNKTFLLDSSPISESRGPNALVDSSSPSIMVDAYAQSIPNTNGTGAVNLCTNDRNGDIIDEEELAKLREELRISNQEAAAYQQMAENFKQQDAAKADLLRSVREECNVLRNRILLIEADVTTSREDHQRLVAEARRARTEVEELRQERDKLLCQLSSANQKVKDSDPVTMDQNDLHRRHTSANFTPHENTSAIQPALSSQQSATNTRVGNSVRSASVSQTITVAECSFSLLVIIPIMVLLSIFTAYIFLKFTH